MTQIPIATKWKFVVEFEDQETGEISGSIGEASSLEECEAFIDYDMEFHRERGRTVVNVEASEIFAECEGEGQVAAGNGGRVICRVCKGHLGPVSKMMPPESEPLLKATYTEINFHELAVLEG